MDQHEARISPGSSLPSHYEVLGVRVPMPCRVRAARAAHVVYTVPAAAARPFLGAALEPFEQEPGYSQLVLGFVDYVDNDLGPYYEVMVVFSVCPSGAQNGPPGTFIYRLPVNSEFSCAAGREIWGFPKTVERIEIQYRKHDVSCALYLDGEFAFSLSVPCVGGIEMPDEETSLFTYTYHPGLCAVPFTSGTCGARVFPEEERVHLELGTHPLAAELKSLGLPKRPVLAMWAENFRGSFGPPQPVQR
ncbi:MAG: hypothetical protein KatS3mg077_1252 [Candidatus Binatia bacterium]|nr:MAG: hypothetical protein KatS3mg077_1252 [Candidatus Binatia bacterium]